MKEITVTYRLDEEDTARLDALLIAYREKGAAFKDIESLFNALMGLGSKWDINNKLIYAELNAGLIDDEEAARRREGKTQEKPKRGRPKKQPIL